MNVLFRNLRAALKLNLSSVTFIAENQNWEEVPRLVQLFDELADQIQGVAGAAPKSQECCLRFQITPGLSNLGLATKRLIRQELVGDAEFFGVTRHRADSTITIDKSVAHPGGLFVNIQRTFNISAPISEIALAIFQDEKEVLAMLGMNELSIS